MAVKERHCFARFVSFEGFNWNSAKTEKLFNKSYNSYIYVTFSGLFTVPYFCRSFSINLSMGDNTC